MYSIYGKGAGVWKSYLCQCLNGRADFVALFINVLWILNSQDFLQEIENFITEAQETLEDAIPNSEKLQKLLDKGNSFDIELSEIPKLKQVLLLRKTTDSFNVQ